ncbi:hypothetical protein [Calothrix sp. 336/3]|uniref:hypothetical protein n=1 Tax=Calothrix sp. 336/3 TaxID=1337936 RepID=UPI0014388297|nr:hypothetical protein [Calothrix sp. 336/3]
MLQVGKPAQRSGSPCQGYGVHTSLKISPSTWFRHLDLGCAIALEACHCEEERRSRSVSLCDSAIAKTTGLCDYFAPLSLRS